MPSITVVDDKQIQSTFTLKYNKTQIPVNLYVGEDDFSIVFPLGNYDKLQFEYLLFDDKLILRRRVNGLYDANKFPDIVIWQK